MKMSSIWPLSNRFKKNISIYITSVVIISEQRTQIEETRAGRLEKTKASPNSVKLKSRKQVRNQEQKTNVTRMT